MSDQEEKKPIRIAVVGTGNTGVQAALLLAAIARDQKNRIEIVDPPKMDDLDKTIVLGGGIPENLRLDGPSCVFSMESIYQDKFMWPGKERQAWKRGNRTSRFVQDDIRRSKRAGYNIATREVPRARFMLESKWWSRALNRQLREGSIQEGVFHTPDYRMKWVWHPKCVARKPYKNRWGL